MYPYYAKWIRSHRDLPLRLNQWNSVGMVSVLSPYSRNGANVSSEMGIQTPSAPPPFTRVPLARVGFWVLFLFKIAY